MAIASTLHDHMAQQGIRYDVVGHPHSHNSMETAEFAHVPGSRLAKSVVLEDDKGFLMAVLPSTQHVRLGVLNRELNRNLRLATEDELALLFGDCELGAIPPLGQLYGLRTIMDDSLVQQPEIYFEAGDHEKLIRMSHDEFMMLMDGVSHVSFGAHTMALPSA